MLVPKTVVNVFKTVLYCSILFFTVLVFGNSVLSKDTNFGHTLESLPIVLARHATDNKEYHVIFTNFGQEILVTMLEESKNLRCNHQERLHIVCKL